MNNVYIDNLKLEGIGFFNKEFNKNLNPGFNIIKDKSESGKSTIIKSILWNLLDKEYEYFENLNEHEKSYVDLSIKFNNKLVHSNKYISNEKEISEELIEYKNKLKELKELFYINDSNFYSEILPEDIINNFNNLNIDKEIKKQISEYEEKSGENFSKNIEEIFNEEETTKREEISALKDLIIKNNEILEKIEKLKNEKENISKNLLKTNEIDKLNSDYQKLTEENEIFKILIKLNLNNVIDIENIESINNNDEILNNALKDMVLKIKKNFSDKYKNFNEKFYNLTLNEEEYRYILEVLNYIENYEIKNINYLIENKNEIINTIDEIISLKDETSEEDLMNYISLNIDNEISNLINDFDFDFEEILKFLKFLELSFNDTLNSMCEYYQIEKENFNTLSQLNHKTPYFIVFQINEMLKNELKNAFKDSISLEFNEDFINEIGELFKNKINFNLNEPTIEKLKSIYKNFTLEESIIKSADLIKEINFIDNRINDNTLKINNVDIIDNKISALDNEIKSINERYDIKEEKIISEIEKRIEKKNKELDLFIKTNIPKIDLKNKYTKEIEYIKEEFENKKSNLIKNNLQIINNYIKKFNKSYEIEIQDNKILFSDSKNKMPLQISKKEHKIIYKIALLQYLNDFFILFNENIVFLIDELENIITKEERENIKNVLNKIDNFQIIYTEKEEN